jgi:hypothetical protein
MSDGQTINNHRPVSLDVFLREWLRRAIRASGIDRRALCAKLTKRLGRQVSLAMLDTWTAETKRDWHIPADGLPSLCDILSDHSPLRQLLNREQREALELGESANRFYRLLGRRLAEVRARHKSSARKK